MQDKKKNEATRELAPPEQSTIKDAVPTKDENDNTVASSSAAGSQPALQEKSEPPLQAESAQSGVDHESPTKLSTSGRVGAVNPYFAHTVDFDADAGQGSAEEADPDQTDTVDVALRPPGGKEDPAFSVSESRGEAPRECKVVANYEILGELGRGGMGVVYKARQIGLNRIVALKMVLAGAHAGEEQLARFYVEAEAVAGLQHPNVVQIYEVGKHDGLPYFSLEFVDGGNLAGKLEGKPQPPREAARILELLARGMACAHKQGIIHRDLKPANVLLTAPLTAEGLPAGSQPSLGVPKITDFGLAKRLESDSSQTKTGTLMGTPSYMAPEQASGNTHEVSPLSDQYALGAILYEMLTGRPPLVGSTVLETLDMVQNKEPLPPSQLQPSVPRDLETICLKCLQKEPAKRYTNTEALADDLRHFLAGEPIKARPVSRLERGWRWCKRNPRVATLSAVTALLIVTAAAALTALWVNSSREEKAAHERAAQEQKAIDETLKLTQERLEQARAAIATGDHERAVTLLGTSDPLLVHAEQLQDVRNQLTTLRSQIEFYVGFKKLLDNARFASRFGSVRLKEQAQKDCLELVALDTELQQRTGRGAAGLPPLDTELQNLFQEDRFEAYLIAAMLETELAEKSAPAVQQEAARRAIDWVNRADQVLPGQRVTYSHRSEWLGTLGKKAESEADFQRAVETKATTAIDHFWHGWAHHRRAMRARQRGDLKDAQDYLKQEIAEYAALLELRPDHFWGYFNWANCNVDLGNLRDAAIGFTACIRIRPDFPWPYNNRGTIHERLGEFEQALQDYTTALRYKPDDTEAHANRGLTRIKLGQLDAALDDLRSAIALNPDYAVAYNYRADVYMKQKKYTEAIADCEKFLALSQNKEAGYLKLADVHNAMGQLEAAVNDCTQALAANSKNANIVYKRAGLLVAGKKYAQAVQDYAAVLELVPKALEPRQDRAKVNWLFLKNFDAALADWDELVKLYPKNPESYYGIGVIKLGRRQYADAQSALERAVQLKPDYVTAHWALTQIALWKGKPEEALKIINPAVEKLTDKHPETLNIRGDVYRALDRLEDAAADYRRLIALKPELVETYVSLALVYEKLNKPELAKECFEKLVGANPNSAVAYLRRAVYRRAHGEFEGAREDCVRARAKDPKSLLPGMVEASILAAQGSAQEAADKVEKLLAQDPKGDGQLLYTAACTLSLASRAAAALPNKEKAAELTKQYARRAVDLLEECLDKGFHDLGYPEHNRMIDDPALEPVRNNPHVRDLVMHRQSVAG
jgi:tetratricopeptide (TPR) repeat protein/serine/threonine protein kinase